MCSPGTIPITVRSCFPIGLAFSYQVQIYSNIGIPIGAPLQINTTSLNGTNELCIPFFVGQTFVGIQAVNLQTGSIAQTSNLVPISSGSQVVFTIQNDSLVILTSAQACQQGNVCVQPCPPKPSCQPCPPKPSCLQPCPPRHHRKPCKVHNKKKICPVHNK